MTVDWSYSRTWHLHVSVFDVYKSQNQVSSGTSGKYPKSRVYSSIGSYLGWFLSHQREDKEGRINRTKMYAYWRSVSRFVLYESSS